MSVSTKSTNCPKCGKPKIQANVRPASPFSVPDPKTGLSADAQYLARKNEALEVSKIIDEALATHFSPAPSWFFTEKKPQRNFTVNVVNDEDENTVPEPKSWFFSK